MLATYFRGKSEIHRGPSGSMVEYLLQNVTSQDIPLHGVSRGARPRRHWKELDASAHSPLGEVVLQFWEDYYASPRMNGWRKTL